MLVGERDIGRKIARYAILGVVVASGSITTPSRTEAHSPNHPSLMIDQQISFLSNNILSQVNWKGWQSVVINIRPQLAQCIPVPQEATTPMPDETPEPEATPTPTDRVCIQVITTACPAGSTNPDDCREFPTPCDVPEDWIIQRPGKSPDVPR